MQYLILERLSRKLSTSDKLVSINNLVLLECYQKACNDFQNYDLGDDINDFENRVYKYWHSYYEDNAY